MADILAQLRVSFLWESDNQEFSPLGNGHSPVLKILLQTAARSYIMATPALTNSASML